MTTNETQYATWTPTKDEYTDEEIKATPLFARIKQGAAIPGPGGKTIFLSDESLLPIARDSIREMWNTLKVSRFSDVVLAFFSALDDAGIDHGNDCNVKRTGEGADAVGTYKPTKNQGRKRFSHEGYAKLIGYGEDVDGDEKSVYKQACEKLKARGLAPSVLSGGFLLVKNQMKNPAKNGTFELVIEEGDKNNKLCSAFKATLHQYPDNKAKVPAIVFPPASGDKGKLVIDQSRTEVPSMSRMMKESILQGAQTPAVMFDLVERLQKLGVDASTVLEDSDDADEASDEETAAPAASEKKPATAPKKSGTKSVLDE